MHARFCPDHDRNTCVHAVKEVRNQENQVHRHRETTALGRFEDAHLRTYARIPGKKMSVKSVHADVSSVGFLPLSVDT